MTTTSIESSPAQSWRLRFEDRGDYVYAEVTGPQDCLEISVQYWRQIDVECARRGTRKLLVCDRLRGEPASPNEFRQLAMLLRDSQLHTIRVAFHEPVPEHLRFVEHGELAMREAGFTWRVFDSEREAELWLRYGDI